MPDASPVKTIEGSLKIIVSLAEISSMNSQKHLFGAIFYL
jgi:hypothetical protein